jgi:hypothetical protein
MQRSTTLVGRKQWWKDGIPNKPILPIVEEVTPELNERNVVCETVTENAAMTGSIKVLSSEESAVRNHFSTSIGSRPCSFEERTRYFNGLGFDIVIFDSKGLYWRIPQDPSNITGTFEIACRITAAKGVTVNSKTSPERIEGILAERMIDKAINKGWKDLGGIHNLKVCEWESVIYTNEFSHEDTLYISELNLFITTITNHLDAPYHPDAIAKVEGRSYGKGITFGAFVNWNDGHKPPNYYVRIAEVTRTLPIVRNPQLPTGVYRFIRDGDKTVAPKLVKDEDLGLTKHWHEIPIFKTVLEADMATSQNIIGQMELDKLESVQRKLNELNVGFSEEKERLIREKETLETKIVMTSLETANEKKELDLELFKLKEEGARRTDTRDDTSSWLKLVAGVATVGIGLWKAFC